MSASQTSKNLLSCDDVEIAAERTAAIGTDERYRGRVGAPHRLRFVAHQIRDAMLIAAVGVHGPKIEVTELSR